MTKKNHINMIQDRSYVLCTVLQIGTTARFSPKTWASTAVSIKHFRFFFFLILRNKGTALCVMFFRYKRTLCDKDHTLNVRLAEMYSNKATPNQQWPTHNINDTFTGTR